LAASVSESCDTLGLVGNEKDLESALRMFRKPVRHCLHHDRLRKEIILNRKQASTRTKSYTGLIMLPRLLARADGGNSNARISAASTLLIVAQEIE